MATNTEVAVWVIIGIIALIVIILLLFAFNRSFRIWVLKNPTPLPTDENLQGIYGPDGTPTMIDIGVSPKHSDSSGRSTDTVISVSPPNTPVSNYTPLPSPSPSLHSAVSSPSLHSADSSPSLHSAASSPSLHSAASSPDTEYDSLDASTEYGSLDASSKASSSWSLDRLFGSDSAPAVDPAPAVGHPLGPLSAFLDDLLMRIRRLEGTDYDTGDVIINKKSGGLVDFVGSITSENSLFKDKDTPSSKETIMSSSFGDILSSWLNRRTITRYIAMSSDGTKTNITYGNNINGLNIDRDKLGMQAKDIEDIMIGASPETCAKLGIRHPVVWSVYKLF